MKSTSMATWSGAVTLAGMVAISPQAEAQTASNADAVYDGYLRAYLVQSGNSAHFTTSISSRSVDYMWNQAEDITGLEDHWYRTYSPATATLVGDLLNTFESNNKGTDWTWDDYNDDLGWATIAFVRGYAITGNAAFLDATEKNFTTVWTRGWDSAGGGGIWEQVGNGNEKQKSILATGTFIVTGAALYQATGNATYLSEAEMAYAWVRANVFNATSSTNSRGAPGHVNEGLTNTNALQNTSNIYNEGLMLESAAALYTLTNNTEYLDDAKLIVAYVEKQWPIVNHQSDMLFRGLGNFAWQNGLWSTYYPYLNANAKAAWNVRRTDYNISNDNFTVATSPTADLQSMQAMSSITIQEATANSFMPPAAVNLSGTYEVQNVASGLALTVSGGATTEGAAVVQVSFASGAEASLWKFVSASTPGYYRIQSVESGLDVNVSSASSVIGALMVQRPAVLTSPWTDQWLPVPNSDGTFSFYNLATTLAIDDPGASAAEKTQLDQWYPNGSDAEKFKLVLVSNAGNDAGAGGDAGGDDASEAQMDGGGAAGVIPTPSDAGSGGPNGSVANPPATGSNGSGCGCVTAGASSRGTSGGLAFFALLGALAVARRPCANRSRVGRHARCGSDARETLDLVAELYIAEHAADGCVIRRPFRRSRRGRRGWHRLARTPRRGVGNQWIFGRLRGERLARRLRCESAMNLHRTLSAGGRLLACALAAGCSSSSSPSNATVTTARGETLPDGSVASEAGITSDSGIAWSDGDATDSGNSIGSPSPCSVRIGAWADLTCGSASKQLWSSVASDAAGDHLIAGSGLSIPPINIESGAWTSSNRGETWTNDSGPIAGPVATNATGTVLVVADGGNVSSAQLFVSTNAGATWSTPSSTTAADGWGGVASDSTGADLVAVGAFAGDIWTSTDFGASWIDRTASGPAHSLDWSSVASRRHPPAHGRALRSTVSFPTSPSTTSSPGRRRRTGMRFCGAHRGRSPKLTVRCSFRNALEVEMKIGVSGASAHLGRAVVSELLRRPGGHDVVAITRTPEPSLDRLRDDSGTTTDPKTLRRPMRVSIVCSSSRPSIQKPGGVGRKTSLPSTRP